MQSLHWVVPPAMEVEKKVEGMKNCSAGQEGVLRKFMSVESTIKIRIHPPAD